MFLLEKRCSFTSEFRVRNCVEMIEQMTKSEELLGRRKKAVANGVGVFNKATVVSAKGATFG